MIYDSSYAQAYACFLTEAPELMQTLEQELLTLQEDRSFDKIYSLMRAVHTLKSVVASLGFTESESIAHSLEDVFNALYDPTVEIDSELESLLFQAFESLRLLLNAEIAQTSIEPAAICQRADEVFAQIQQKIPDVSERETYLPWQAELKTDITRSIFESAIQENLHSLAEALTQPNSALATTLRKKATVFLSFAEGLNLPGFAAIAQTTIAALEAHPNQAATIARIALADFQQGLALVLAGDRTWGGEPSITLQQFALTPNQLTDDRSTSAQSRSSQLAPNLVRTIRVDLERLNRLKYSTGGLIDNQNQQDSAKKRLQQTLQKFRANFEQHQQTLNQIRETLNQIRARPRTIDQELLTGSTNLNGLMQSAMEESAQLEESIVQVELVHQQWSQALKNQQQIVTLIQDNLTEAQMAPLGDVFNRFVLVLQRLVTVYSKPAELKLSGTQIMVDKAIAEKLYEPLLHLVRNAFAHGIEPAAVRQQLGKPHTGQIQILAHQQEQELFIEVKDDGAGLDCNRIRERAVQKGILSQVEAIEQSDLQIQQLLFEPGFSTSNQVSELSGRGMGLGIVRSVLQAIQGSISVQSVPLEGTTFTMQIPLLLPVMPLPTFSRVQQRELLMVENFGEPSAAASLEDVFGNSPLDIPLLDPTELTAIGIVSSSDAMALCCPLPERSLLTTQHLIWASETFIFFLPYSKIEENLPYKPQQRILSQNQYFFHWRNQMLRLFPLVELLKSDRSSAIDNQVNSKAAITLIVRHNRQLIALEAAIERLITKPEIVLQSPPSNSMLLPAYIPGYTRLENNQLVPVINVETLIEQTAL